MIKPYFTRKNFITLSLTIFYAFVILFCGMCIEGGHSFTAANNPIAKLAEAFNFSVIECKTSGFVCLVLVAIYIVVFVGMFLYEKQFAIVNNKKVFGPKMVVTYALSFLACLVLSLGIGILIQRPLNGENIGNVLKFVGQSVVLGTIVYAILFAFLGGILMFIINYLLIDKPFRSTDKVKLPDFGEESEDDDQDITKNFDSKPQQGVGVGNIQGTGEFGASGASGVIKQVEQLDDREKVFPGLSTMDQNYEGYAVEKHPTDNYTLEEICVKFRNYLAKKENLYFDIDTIRYFVSGFAASHFMILEGISGTGKSSLPRYFAKFINAELTFIPVQATWRDKTNLLGYFNDFSKTYTESEFLLKLYHANYNPDMIHIFVLDEMNISRVEYYFADFLSVLEYPKDEWRMQLMQLPYGFVPPARLDNGYIKIPSNSYFVGTANKDDSTFTITDKVYDRAITIDFQDRNKAFEVNEEVETISLSESGLEKLYNAATSNTANKMTQSDYDRFMSVTDFIYDKFDITFGNRILNQIDAIVPVFIACGGKKEDALDFLLSRKIISKIEGRFEDYVKNALKDLLTLIQRVYGADALPRSEKTIKSLMRRL